MISNQLEKDIIKAQKGNKEAFAKCISSCQDTMFRVAISILHSKDLSGDAIQESILKAYKMKELPNE
jgi:DNA-directed RNA polymerase specialized sigma24 family protein